MGTSDVETRIGRLTVSVEGEVGAGGEVGVEVGRRPTALLWHSLFVDERTWGRVTEDLARDRRLVLVTGPGHGRSGDPGHRYTMEDCAEAALQVLEAVGVDGPVDWVGNAWGGHVGIVLAARHPDRLRTLVTAGTPVQPYRPADRVSTSLLVAIYRCVGPRRFLADAVVEALVSDRTRASDPAAAALVRDCFSGAERRGMVNAVVSVSLNRVDLTPLLSAVRMPTLFITGTAHSDWSPDQMRAAAALLPQGTTHVIDDVAYLAPLEAPAEFSRTVRGFWAAHELEGFGPGAGV